MNAPEQPRPQTGALILAWIFVGVPAVWGVAQTVLKSLALFR
jgi:hypothetical protein